jgi:hypothetical protein
MQLTERAINPMGPQYMQGIGQQAPGYFDLPFDYVFTVTLTANQVLNQQAQLIHTDSIFLWRALVFGSTGVFSVRFADSQGYYLSDGQVDSGNLSNDGSSPYIIFPEVPLPRGGRIGIDLTDLSGNQNRIQLVFKGVKRFSL